MQDYEIRPQETRNIALSYGVEISTVYCFILSQYTRLTDRQTGRRTDRPTDRQTVGQMWIAKCDLTKLDAHKYAHITLCVCAHYLVQEAQLPQGQRASNIALSYDAKAISIKKVTCLSIMHSFSVTSANIAKSDTSLKLNSLYDIFMADSKGLSLTNLTYWATKPNSVK